MSTTKNTGHTDAIKTLLNRLTASIRGQIFLCNLESSIQAGWVDAGAVSAVFKTITPRSIQHMHEDDLLGHLRLLLQSPSSKLMLQHSRSAIFSDFSSGQPLVNVMRLEDFEAYYADPSERIRGHDFFKLVIGAQTQAYCTSATTNAICWVAPTTAFSTREPLEKNAEAARDILGLVHHGKGVRLVALQFHPPAKYCYHPTAIESIPNARFRQTSPDHPAETRWGFTVDLSLLDSAASGASILGKPELIFSQLELRDCVVSGFFYLGETLSDRDTTSADTNFLRDLSGTKSISDVVSELEISLSP